MPPPLTLRKRIPSPEVTLHARVAFWRSTAALLGVALLIAVLTTLSRVQTSADASFSLFWPSAGIGLALLARFGWWGLLSTALGVALWAGWVMHWSPLAVVWCMAASTAGPYFTWYLIRTQWRALQQPFSSSVSVLQFMRAQAFAGSVVAAVVGSAGLWMTGHWPSDVPWLSGLLAYWVIETTGAFLFAPVAWDALNPRQVAGLQAWGARLRKTLWAQWRYAAMVLLLTAGVVGLLFVGQNNYAQALLFALLPMLVVVSLRAAPVLVHVLILGSGALVLMTMAYLSKASGIAIDEAELLLVALYLLVGTAALEVLLATSAEKRQALERLERQAFADPLTRLLNEAGVARQLEDWADPFTGDAPPPQLGLIGLALSNMRQAASLGSNVALSQLDRQMADQLRSSVPEVRWARVGTGQFQGVWRGNTQALDALLLRITLLTVPLLSVPLVDQEVSDAPPVPAFRAHWSVAAVTRAATISIDNLVQAMVMALAQAQIQAQQFRRVEMIAIDNRFVAALQQEAALVEQVSRAIESRTLLLYAQPIVSNRPDVVQAWQAGDAPVCKFEVLVRMAGEQGRVISPGEFLPAAMRAGLMSQLDLAVLEQTFAWLAANPQAVALIEGCAVNLSGPTVGDARTVAFIKNLFERYRVSPSIMIFEITESMAVTDTEVAAQTLKDLRAMGSRVAIDDFGTGMATFDYLKQFEVDFIKIDGTFIRALQEGKLDRVIVESMVNVARCLGVRTVAEFVSSAALHAQVTALGIDESQGYLLGEPRPLGNWYPQC
jgi:EAL domain-containing protein (putative c-di-GMP-specific phosphodiesterase class I)/GGDEF domain-containing protein